MDKGDKNKDMNKDVTKYLIGGVVGLLLGWMVAGAMKPQANAMKTTNPDGSMVMSAKATDTHGLIRSGFQQHAAVTADYLVKILKGEDTTAIRAGLDKNTQELADVFAQVYGNDKRADFVNMWNGHIKEYEDYTSAVKNGDEAAKTKAKSNLMAMSDTLEKTMDDLNTQPVDKISDLMQEHVTGTLAIIDAAAAKDDAKVVDLMDMGFKQAGSFGDYFFNIVYSEKPDMFK